MKFAIIAGRVGTATISPQKPKPGAPGVTCAGQKDSQRTLKMPNGSALKQQKAKKKPGSISKLEAQLLQQLKLAKLDAGMVQELVFAKPRRWRFDFAWVATKVAVEVQGGTWSGGRHTRGGGYQADLEKVNAAVLRGWRVLQFTAFDVSSGRALAQIESILKD